MCDEEPSLCRGDGFLPILGEPAASSEPCEGALDDPSAGDQFEPLRGVGTLDDFQCPLADLAGAPRSFPPRSRPQRPRKTLKATGEPAPYLKSSTKRGKAYGNTN